MWKGYTRPLLKKTEGRSGEKQSISQGSPVKQNQKAIEVDRYKKRFNIGIGSCDYRCQEVPWCAVFKLEIRKSQVQSKGPRLGGLMMWAPVWRLKNQEKMGVLAQVKNKFAISLPFGSLWALNRLNNTTYTEENESSLLCLLIQSLISSRNTFTDSPRNSVLPSIWAFLGPVKFTHKINH